MAGTSFKIRFDVIGLVGIVVGLAGLYTYYKGTKPSLELVVESATNVVDVNERVAGLGVIFNGEDLLQRSKALTIYSLTLKNSGNDSIRKGDFDETALVGVSLPGAAILNAQVDDSRTSAEPYVQNNAQLVINAPSIVLLKPIILDPGDKIGLRIVAIHGSSLKPKVNAVGKVVGQKTIPVSIRSDEEQETSIWARALGGGLGVNLLRLPIYFFGFLVVLGVAIGVPVAIGEVRTSRRRKRLARQYLSGRAKTPARQWIVEKYKSNGVSSIRSLKEIAENPNRPPRRRIRHSGGRVVEWVDFEGAPGVVFEMGSDLEYGDAVQSGLLQAGENGVFAANANMKGELEAFLSFLEENGELNDQSELGRVAEAVVESSE